MHVSVGVCLCVCGCVSLSVCLWNREHVRRRCCCSRLSCYLQQRVYRPPQAGRGYPMLTCLIVCLSQGPLVGVCVCVPAAQRRTRAMTDTDTHVHTQQIHIRGRDKIQKKKKKQKNNTHGVSVRYCQAHLVSVCPIKEASLKSACCFECAETVHTSHPQIWKVPAMAEMGAWWTMNVGPSRTSVH